MTYTQSLMNRIFITVDIISIMAAEKFISGKIPVFQYLFKVSKITLEQRPNGRFSNFILLTLKRYLPTGLSVFFENVSIVHSIKLYQTVM